MSHFKEIANSSKFYLSVYILVVLLISIDLLISSVEISYGQNSAVNDTQVQISKTASSNTVISDGSSSVGGFSTTYMITGTAADIKNSKDLILKTVTDDFTNSSTVGYVNLSDSSEIIGNQQIANPFASNEQIKQKIQTVLNTSIAGTNKSQANIVSMTCNFGSSLDLFSCSVSSLP